MTNARIFLLFCGRYPSEKAAALFADLEAQSFAARGISVTVVVPRRSGRGELQLRNYRVMHIPTLDLARIPVLWSFANTLTICIFSVWFTVWFATRGTRADIIMGNDALPLVLASLVSNNTVYELHDFVGQRWLYRILFRRLRFVLATNEWKAKEIHEQFAVPREKIIVERNAVDVMRFGVLSKHDARAALGLDAHATYAVYTGHLYDWKGADTFARAAALIPHIQCVFVGGTPNDVSRFKKEFQGVTNIRIVGHVSHDDIPRWQAAADVLVLPNSGKEEISIHYTSPMKLFEYMASKRPIVASDLPSIREIAGETIQYAEADDPQSFSDVIQAAAQQSAETVARVEQAYASVQEHTWEKRAARIISTYTL